MPCTPEASCARANASDYAAFATMERDGWSDVGTARAHAAASAQHARSLVRAVRACSGTRALDPCCGHGVVCEGLAAVGADVTGLDLSPAMLTMARDRVPAAELSPAMLTMARDRVPAAELIEGDAPALPFADASLEAVTIGLDLPHAPDPDRVLAEAGRVLASGGRIGPTCWPGPERYVAMRGEQIGRRAPPEPATSVPRRRASPDPRRSFCPESPPPSPPRRG